MKNYNCELAVLARTYFPYREKYLAVVYKLLGAPNHKKKALKKRLEKMMKKHLDDIGPTPHDVEFLKIEILRIAKLNPDQRKYEARILLCWILDDLAQMNKAPRLQFVAFCQDKGDFDNFENGLAKLIRLADPGYGEKDGNGVPRRLTRNIFKEWFEEFDIPNFDQIDSNKQWFTDYEMIAISRASPSPDFPQTLSGLRKKAKREKWREKGKSRLPNNII
jgi:hypothetical protein